MAFIALKPCSFAGETFRIGADVPGDLVRPEAVKRLLSMGILVRKPGASDSRQESAKPAKKPRGKEAGDV